MRIEYGSQSTWIYCEENLLLADAISAWSGKKGEPSLQAAIENRHPILIDAKDLTQIDTAGIQLLLNLILQKVSIKWQGISKTLFEKAANLGVQTLLELRPAIHKVKLTPDLLTILPSFIEEGLENLKDLEEALLTSQLQNIDSENLNHFFRIIHSIKGNSALLGFDIIKELTHAVESFLDETRKNPKKLEFSHIELLLKVCSELNTFFNSIQKNKSYDETPLIRQQKIFLELTRRIKSNRILKPGEPATLGWHITCKNQSLFKNEQDLETIFKEIKQFGELEVFTSINQMPNFLNFNPEICYLSFELFLYSDITLKKLKDILKKQFEEKDITALPILYSDKEPLDPSQIGESSLQNLPNITSIRVPVEKIETVMNSVSELVIVESMFKQALEEIGTKSDKINEILDFMYKNSRELEESVLHIGIVPVTFLVNRFHKTIFELADQLGKKVKFSIHGENNELDKKIIEKLADPLLHLFRNAIDHGIESPEIREAIGKPKFGTLSFNCYQEGETIIIEIKDDGAGIDPEKVKKLAISKQLISEQEKLNNDEILQLLFRPGFSTRENVSEVSGRGVGLDVVEKNIRSLGGSIELNAVLGEGTVFKLKLPLTSAIIECQVFTIGEDIYIIPTTDVLEMMSFDPKKIIIENHVLYYDYNKDLVRIINLGELFSQKYKSNFHKEYLFAILVKGIEKPVLIPCDDLLQQQRIVVKNIEDNFCKIPGIAGASILGDGKVGLILDLREITEFVLNLQEPPTITVKDFLGFNWEQEDKGVFDEDQSNLDAMKIMEYIDFQLNNNYFGIPLAIIREIYRWKRPSLIPFAPPYLMGLINYRGLIIPIIDLQHFMGSFHIQTKDTNIFIILNIGDEDKEKKKIIGFAIDNMPDITNFYPRDIQPFANVEFLQKPTCPLSMIDGVVDFEDKQVTLLNFGHKGKENGIHI